MIESQGRERELMRLELTTLQLDALQEIGNISTGHAATTLSEALGRRVSISVPRTALEDVERVPMLFGSPETVVVMLHRMVEKNLRASILLVFQMEQAKQFADLLAGQTKGTCLSLSHQEIGLLQKVGFDSLKSYFQAMGEVVGLDLEVSEPALAIDMVQALLDELLVNLALEIENIVIMETDFAVDDDRIKGHFLFLPEPRALDSIFKQLGI